MANELGPIFTTTGTTVRGMLFNQSGQVRDVVHAAWDTWADGDIDDYDIAITELGTSGIYYGTAPGGVTVDAGEYDLVCYAGSVSLTNIRATFAQRKVGATNSNVTHVANDAASMVTEFNTNITKINGVDVELVDSFDANVTAMAANVLTASALATDAVSEIAAQVLDTETLDVGLTVRHGLELAASLYNKIGGAGTNTETRRNFSDTANLATMTVDGSGNISAIAYDFSI